MNKQNAADFSQGSIGSRIMAQAIPLSLAEIVQLLYNIVDRIFLGHLPDGNTLALTGVGLYVFAPQLMGIFTADAAVIALGARVLRIEAFAEPMFGASIVASGSMQGAGDSTGCFVLNLVSMWGVRLTLAVLLAPRFGLVGVWVAMCAELCTRGVLFLLRMARGKWLDKGALA